jgi:regulatory protein
MTQVPGPPATLADDLAALDSEAAAACAADAVGPSSKAPLQRADAAATSPEARLQRALDLGYRHLGKRDRTEAELRRHLAAKDVDDASVDGAVEALARQGYLDDARYARMFAEDRRALDSWGPERIERRLLELGVAPELVALALAARDGAGELEAAVALLARRFGAPPDCDRERDRALRMLARKGYDLELAYDAVRAFARAAGKSD